jgi:putative toxin-antitoxin system antitoxin component (TIGR02293 family)
MEMHPETPKKAIEYFEEPILAYYTKQTHSLKASSIRTSSIGLARKGVSRKEIDDLMAFYLLDLEEISRLLGVSSRTLMRKDDSSVLGIHISQQVIYLILLAQKGIAIFQSKLDFNDWLRTPLIALGNSKPLDYLDTGFGVQEIMNQLGRIEYGVYA